MAVVFINVLEQCCRLYDAVKQLVAYNASNTIDMVTVKLKVDDNELPKTDIKDKSLDNSKCIYIPDNSSDY